MDFFAVPVRCVPVRMPCGNNNHTNRYSAGATLYAFVFGRVPFPATNFMEMVEQKLQVGGRRRRGREGEGGEGGARRGARREGSGRGHRTRYPPTHSPTPRTPCTCTCNLQHVTAAALLDGAGGRPRRDAVASAWASARLGGGDPPRDATAARPAVGADALRPTGAHHAGAGERAPLDHTGGHAPAAPAQLRKK